MNKQDYQRLLLDIISPLRRSISGKKARLSLGGHAAWQEDIPSQIGNFARLLFGLAPFLAGGGRDEELEALYSEGIAALSDPRSPEYHGDGRDFDLRFSDMAAFSFGLLFSPQTLWEPLDDTAKENLAKWLWQINMREIFDDSRIFFRILVNLALKKLNQRYSEERLEADISRIDDFYIANGWYSDGERGQKDYSIASSMHFYGLIFAKFAENDYPMYSKRFKRRAADFAEDFIYLFADSGEALPYGRSLERRFEQISFWSACLIAGVYPFSEGVIKGIIERNLELWFKSDMFDRAGIMTVGYKYPNPSVSERDGFLGSPYFALKAFVLLALEDNHSFWSAEALPLPGLDALHTINGADMLISRENGSVTAYMAGACREPQGGLASKLLKFAYSTKFGFSIACGALSPEEAACDSMLCFTVDKLALTRRRTDSFSVTDDRLTVSWSPVKGMEVTTEIVPNDCGHVRTHTVKSEYPCVAYDCGFAVSAADIDCCEVQVSQNGASAKNNFSFCAVIGGEGYIFHSAQNTNIMRPKTVIPCVKHVIEKGVTVIKTTIITR